MRHRVAKARFRELGAELRKIRRTAGLTGAELAQRTGWSPNKISRIESGHIGVSMVDVPHYLGFCGAMSPAVHDLMRRSELAHNDLGYWLGPRGELLGSSLSSLIFHEAAADVSVSYEPTLVPGLLQTADYARARMSQEHWRSSAEIDRFVNIRMERQRILNLAGTTRFVFLVHEHALRYRAGGPEMMHEQMLKLLLLAGTPRLAIHVVPARYEFGGSFRVFDFQRQDPLVYLDNVSSGLFLEGRQFVTPYRRLAPEVVGSAWDEEQSREFIAALAHEYDRGSDLGAGARVEEEPR